MIKSKNTDINYYVMIFSLQVKYPLKTKVITFDAWMAFICYNYVVDQLFFLVLSFSF